MCQGIAGSTGGLVQRSPDSCYAETGPPPFWLVSHVMGGCRCCRAPERPVSAHSEAPQGRNPTASCCLNVKLFCYASASAATHQREGNARPRMRARGSVAATKRFTPPPTSGGRANRRKPGSPTQRRGPRIPNPDHPSHAEQNQQGSGDAPRAGPNQPAAQKRHRQQERGNRGRRSKRRSSAFEKPFFV